MKYAELANLLTGKAKGYRNQLVSNIVPKLQGQPITTEVIHEVLNPYLESVRLKVLPEVAQMLDKRFEEWVPQAVESVRRDSHMNQAQGESVLSPDWAEALLVSFVNRACIPMDLAFYTIDLQKKPTSDEVTEKSSLM